MCRVDFDGQVVMCLSKFVGPLEASIRTCYRWPISNNLPDNSDISGHNKMPWQYLPNGMIANASVA